MRVKLVVSIVALLGALLVGVSPAAAGDDPYGSTSTTAPTDVDPTCSLSATSGVPGTSVRVTVTNIEQGDTVRVLFDGSEVGRDTADDGVEPATTLSIDFVVPALAPGDYLVTAVGDTFTLPCGPGAGGTFEILAAATDPGDGGTLPFTGIELALFLVVAIVLLLGGRAALAESRRRRRRAAASALGPHPGCSAVR